MLPSSPSLPTRMRSPNGSVSTEVPKRNVGNHVNQQANLLAGRSATVLDGSNVHGRVLAGASGAGAPALTGRCAVAD